ncbi:MAG TPA: lytic transglycosylase domain-containing protein [Solirubrobacterales bacterium]|nr:lytic transglycosylase domain-containing protein [Solirubrobacterales bacterium]
MESASLPAARPSKLLLGLPLALLAGLVVALLGLALLFGGSPGCGGGEAAGGVGGGVPPRLAPIYEAAAARYGLGGRGPAVLAAINFVETDFGRNLGTSSAGAIGWMQFEPSSWTAYGVDANGDGRKDPYNPEDAIFAAANLLRAAGAPRDWRAAIFTYNHAGWYVAEVLADARRFAGPAATAQLAGFGPACAAAALAPNEAIARMVAEAARLSALRPQSTYVWGGSHGLSPTPPNGPFDCSSAVSHLLQVGGFRNPTMDTVGLASWGEAGPGRWLTIYVKPYGPEAHTFVEFMPGTTPPAARYWGTSGLHPGEGPGWIPEGRFSAGYLAGFQLRHPPGL